MTLQIPAINNRDTAGTTHVSEQIFGRQFNATLVHQLVVRHLAGARAGTVAQKNRAAVSGGGAKPWRQKGTGRARAGTLSSPIWRSGGVTFATQPRSYIQKINKKMYKAGICCILSELLRQERLVASNEIMPNSTKTKDLVAKLSAVASRRILIVVDKLTDNLILSSRNIPYVGIATVANISPVGLVATHKMIVTSAAIKQIEERLA